MLFLNYASHKEIVFIFVFKAHYSFSLVSLPFKKILVACLTDSDNIYIHVCKIAVSALLNGLESFSFSETIACLNSFHYLL